jgi:hypothetical protein
MTSRPFAYEYDLGRRIEILATWYLRFHGYLTTPHFVLHRPDGTQYTEADILGVRFPHSAEDVVTGGPDPALNVRSDLIDVVIAECSADAAKLNQPWKDDFDHHLQYVLRYIGIFERDRPPEVIKKLHEAADLQYEWPGTLGLRFRLRFLLFSKSLNCERGLRPVTKIRLQDMLNYLGVRFRCYSTPEQMVRSAHSQWDPFINELYSRLMPAHDVSPEPIEQTLSWVLGRTRARHAETGS